MSCVSVRLKDTGIICVNGTSEAKNGFTLLQNEALLRCYVEPLSLSHRQTLSVPFISA